MQEPAGAAGNATVAKQVGCYTRRHPRPFRHRPQRYRRKWVLLEAMPIGPTPHSHRQRRKWGVPARADKRASWRCEHHDGNLRGTLLMNQLHGDRVSFRALFFRHCQGRRCRVRFPAHVHCRRRFRDPGRARRRCPCLPPDGRSGTWLCMKRPRQRDGSRSARLAPGTDWGFLPRQAGLLRQKAQRERPRLP